MGQITIFLYVSITHFWPGELAQKWVTVRLIHGNKELIGRASGRETTSAGRGLTRLVRVGCSPIITLEQWGYLCGLCGMREMAATTWGVVYLPSSRTYFKKRQPKSVGRDSHTVQELQMSK